MVKAPISIGELVDKISILEIKREKLTDLTQLENVEFELEQLQTAMFEERVPFNMILNLYDELIFINRRLWKIEDKIRAKERDKNFDSGFVELARQVYFTNDQRSDVKRRINEKLGSRIIETKVYEEY